MSTAWRMEASWGKGEVAQRVEGRGAQHLEHLAARRDACQRDADLETTSSGISPVFFTG
jgi:hypothetical protein